jgi:DNA repair protein RadC
MLLYWAYPRQDVKPLAKQLLGALGSLSHVVAATPQRLMEFGASGAEFAFAFLQEISRRLLQEELRTMPLLNNTTRVIEYCRLTMSHLTQEQFRLFFLDRKYFLISDEVQHSGTLDQTSLYPREVMKRALVLNAAALILIHNHPSGDPHPSSADISLTHHLQSSLLPFNIRLLDHFIIGRYGYFSFREQQLLHKIDP